MYILYISLWSDESEMAVQHLSWGPSPHCLDPGNLDMATAASVERGSAGECSEYSLLNSMLSVFECHSRPFSLSKVHS
jgi:hypothetical protein